MLDFAVLTVSQLNRFIKSMIDTQELLKETYIKGEISNFTHHFSSGHFYFSLKDNQATIRCVMFSQFAGQLAFMPENGMSVIVRGTVSVFERDGIYQLYVHDMQPDGVGAAFLSFQQIKNRLEAAGVFDPAQKRPLPTFPQYIGVITSASGAAFQDVTNIIARRFASATVLFCPAIVQGAAAEASILAGLETLNADGRAEVIILCRGGGSLEDLASFNSEKLAYAIRSSRIPVVSGVGHETDTSICDFAADLWAPTPSAAAELVTPDGEALKRRLVAVQKGLHDVMAWRLRTQQNLLDEYRGRMAVKSPGFFLAKNRQRLDFLVKLLGDRYKDVISRKNIQIEQFSRLLDSLGPLKVLERGYSITRKDGKAVTHASCLREGDCITTVLRRGQVYSQVVAVEEKREKADG